jgi:tetratricopeptide (TPR) repeat protein
MRFFSRPMRVTSVLGLIVLVPAGVLAQSLKAQPWPPANDGKFALVGEDFPAQTRLRLSFANPKPELQDESSLPSELLTDASGAFRLPLVARGSVEVRVTLTENGVERRVSLELPSVNPTPSTAPSPSPATPPATQPLTPLTPPPTTTPPASPTPAPTPPARPAPSGPTTVKLENGVLIGERGGVVVWRADTTSTLPPITVEPNVVIAEGNTLVAHDQDTGRAAWRAFLSGPITALESSGTDIRATITHNADVRATETFVVRGGKPTGRVTFPPSNTLLESLEATATRNLVFDGTNFKDAASAERLTGQRATQDPTNPFHAFYHGKALEQTGRAIEAIKAFESALNTSAPFYVFVRLAALLEAQKRPDLADRALQNARKTWASAGYDPGFRVGKVALAAWGNPLEQTRTLFRSGDALRGGVWLSFLRTTMPHFEGYERVYTEYATWLEGQARPGEALDWQGFTTELAQGTTLQLGEEALPRLSGLALGGIAALLMAFLALQLVLAAKYWVVQGQDLRPLGGRYGSWGRNPLVRLRHILPAYHTLTEKLVSLTLLLLAAGGLVVWAWATRGQETLRATLLAAGTVGGEAFYTALSGLPQSPGLEALRGLGSQLDGEAERALEAYRNAPQSALAQNNLGVINAARGDQAGAQAAYRQAATLEPNALAPRWNLGLNPTGYRVGFHNSFNPKTPMLSVPESHALLETTTGDLGSEFARLAANPWAYLLNLPFSLPEWARIAVAVGILTVLALTLLMLLIPRVRSARTAPRGLIYELLALLIPGTGLADEVWGIVLLVPWAVVGGALLVLNFGTLLLPEVLAPSSPLGLAQVPPFVNLASVQMWLYIALAVIYAINFVGWLLEFIAFRRRRAAVQPVAQTTRVP